MQAFQPAEIYRIAKASTIVEIMQAFQPQTDSKRCEPIYNSRNYASLSTLKNAPLAIVSTIVEIMQAFQPVNKAVKNARSTIVEIMQAFQPTSDNEQHL